MTATLAEIMDEMADAIRGTLDDVTDVDVQVEPRMVLNPTPPCIDLYPGDPSTDPLLAGFGADHGGELIVVRARISTADHEAQQSLLLALMDADTDPLSVWLALEDDQTLGGLASDVTVNSRSGYAIFPSIDGAGAWLGCIWAVSVIKALS